MGTFLVFTVRGVSPVTEQVVEVEIIADSEAQARRTAADAGLRMVMVAGCVEMTDPDTDRVTE